jgi:type VI secretion system protein ImpE
MTPTLQAALAERSNGDLSGALARMTDLVKQSPADVIRRLMLGETLVAVGDLERADKQFDIALSQDPSWAARLALRRQLVRAEQTRREVFASGAMPELLFDPDPYLTLCLKLLVDLRAGDASAAAKTAQAAEALRPVRSVVIDGVSQTDLRDIDDVTAGIAEILTSTGKYFWVPLHRIDRVTFDPPQTFLDTLWRPCTMEVTEGPSGVVYWPALYPEGSLGPTDAFRLGRETDWSEASGVNRGAGLRCFLLEDDVVPISEIGEIIFNA